MSEFDGDVTLGFSSAFENTLSNLSLAQQFLLFMRNDRRMLMMALVNIMLNNGVYDFDLNNDSVESIGGYDLAIKMDNNNVRFSIIFPDQGENKEKNAE